MQEKGRCDRRRAGGAGKEASIFRMMLQLTVFLLLLSLWSAPAVLAAGGDIVTPFPVRENRAGKQTPTASVVDGAGNVIITGFQMPLGSSIDEFYTVKVNRTGAVVWRAVYAVPGFSARAVAVAVDQGGNVFVTGNVNGANSNVVTVKYGVGAVPDGNGQITESWAVNFDGGGADSATAITVATGNGYVFVGGSSRYQGNESVMVLKYQDSGASASLEWQVPNAQSATIGRARAMAVNDASVAVTGQTWSGASHYFTTLVYDLAGQKLWERQYTMPAPPPGHQYDDSGMFVKFDSKGHLAVAGTVYNDSNTDIYTAKYCASGVSPCTGKTAGDVLWEKTYDGGSDDEPNGLAVDPESSFLDDVYVTGHSMATSGRNHMVAVRYQDAAVAPVEKWRALFNSGDDNTDIPAAVAVDGSGSLYVAGYTEASGNTDFLTVKYRKNCVIANGLCGELWSRSFNSGNDLNDRAVAVGLDPQNGQLFVAGYADETKPLRSGSATAAIGTGDQPVRLADSTANWSPNQWAGYYVMVTGGVNKDEFRQILGNDATSLTLAYNFANSVGGITVAPGDGYYIYDHDDLDYYLVKYDQGLLNAPTNLVAAAAANTAINLTWQDNNDALPKFRMERCTSGSEHLIDDFMDSCELTVVADGISSTSVQDTGLTPDRYYYYRVTAYTGTDFATADQVTYPSNVAHAIAQYVTAIPPAKSFIYAGVASNDDYALTVAVGPDRNPVVSGKSYFEPGGFDYYTVKLDRGTLARSWSQRYNDIEEQADVAMCLAVDNNNQIAVSGYSWLNNPAVNPPFGTDMNSIYTIKYLANAAAEPETDPALVNQWTHQYNGPGGGDDRAIAIVASSDAANNIAVVGMGLHSSSDLQKHDIYVLHYPQGGPGTPQSPNAGYWAATPIHKGDDNQPTAVAFDPWGNVIVTGFTGNLSGSDFSYDIYTAKFAAATGALLWERTYDGLHGDDMANDVTVDGDGNVYVSGFTTSDRGDWDFITLKYDRYGTVQWGGGKTYNGPVGGEDEAISIKFDPIDRSVVVAGNRLTDAGNNDIHLIRYRTTDGSVIWQKSLLREGTDEDMVDMAIDPSGSVHVTATTTNGANPDPDRNKDILTFKVDAAGVISGNVTAYGSTLWQDKPYGIVANSWGELFIAGIAMNGLDNADYVVLKIDGDDIQSPYPVTAVAAYTGVTLNWSDNSRSEDGYQVARQAGACPSEPVVWADNQIISPADLAVTTWSDTGFAPDQTYCYGVRARKGTSYSRWVNVGATVATPPVPNVAFTTNPDIPNITAETAYGARAVDTTTAKVVWSAPAYVQSPTGYEVERCMDDTTTPCTIFTHLATMTDRDGANNLLTYYTDQTVCPGATYRYRVKAYYCDPGSPGCTPATPTWASAFSASSGVVLPTADNLVVDSGFESADPETPWFSPVGSTLAESDSFAAQAAYSGSKGFALSLNNSVIANPDWNTVVTTPATATLGTPTGNLDDSSPFQAWKTRSQLAGALTANTVHAVTIPRNTASTDPASEPQAGFRDVRFYDASAQAELPFLLVTIASSDASATFWFKTGNTTSAIYAYYGNATADLTSSRIGNVAYKGRKQPVLMRNGGKYDMSAWLRANLAKGAVTVNFSQDAYTTSSPAVTSGMVIDSSSSSAGNSVSHHAYNDAAWHQLTNTITSTSATGSTYVRAYLLRSPYDAAFPVNYPSGTVDIDEIRVAPNYALTATRVSERQIDLAWANSSYDATGYRIERCPGTDTYCSSNPGDFTQIATVSAGTAAYSDYGTAADSTYTYRIRPYKTFAQVCTGTPGWNGSGWDGAYSAVTPAASAVTSNAPPSSLTAKAASTTQVTLAWLDSTSTETGFELWRCSLYGCSNFVKVPLEIGTSSGTGSTVSLSDTTACNSTTFTYKVKAVDNGLTLSGNGAWTRRVPFTITNGQPNFQTRLTVSYLTGMNNDFSDLRLYDATTNRELPYWVDSMSPGNSITMWFKPPTSGNSFYLYYGNLAATAPNYSGSLIFDFFDDFPGTSLGAQWVPSIAGSATLAVSNGLVTLDATANASHTSYVSMAKASGLTPPYRLETRVNVSASYLGQGLIRVRGLGGIGDTGIFDVGGNKLQAYFNSTATNAQIPADQFVRWRAAHTGGDTNSWNVFNEDGTQIYATTYTGTPSGVYLAAGDGGGGNGKFSVDWVFARKYAAVEPSVVLGTPENDGAGYVFALAWDGPFSNAASATTPAPVNLVADPDFENGATSWPTAVGTTTGTSFDTSAGNQYSGNNGFKLGATGATLGRSQAVAVVPNSSYTLSGYIKTALTSGAAQCDVYGTGIDSPGITGSGTSSWTYKSETVTIPSGTTSVSVRCFANGGPQGSAWFDMIQLVPVVPVSSLTATRASEAKIDLAWTFPTSVTDLTGFKIDRCGDSACTSVLATLTVPGASTRTYSDTGLTSINTTYWYRIRAFKTENPSCNGSKGFWESAGSSAPYPSAPTTLTAPGAPGLSHAVTTSCEDIRLIDSDGTTRLKYYIENKYDTNSACNRTATKFIVNFPSIPAGGKTINLYYGNQTASAGDSSGSDVFDFFDDFDGSAIDTGKWVVTDGSGFSVASSLLHGTSTNGILTSKAPYTFGAGYQVQSRTKTATFPASGFTPIGFSSGWSNNVGWLHAPGTEYYSNNNAYTQMTGTPPAGTAQTDYLNFAVVLKSSTTANPQMSDIDKNVNYWNPGDISQSVTARPIVLGRRYDGGGGYQTYSADWDWIRVRKYASPAPSSTIGAVDTAGAPYTLSGDAGSWRFRKPVTINYDAGAATLGNYQVNVVFDTTQLAFDRNTLTWNDTAGSETGFRVERCDGDDCTTASFPRVDRSFDVSSASGINTPVSYTDKETAINTNYCYRVKAVNAAWTTATPVPGESPASNIVCQRSDNPGAPTNVIATPGTSSISVSWTDNSRNETGFKLERCQDDTNGETQCAFLPGNTTVTWLPPNDNSLSATGTYNDASVGCAGTFRYRLTAYRGVPDAPDWSRGPTALSGYSVSGVFTAADAVTIGVPAAPSNVVATRASEQQINVTWTDSTPDESGFEVWRCSCTGTSCTTCTTGYAKLPVTVGASSGTGGTVTFNDTYFITPGTLYGYQVKSVVTGTCFGTSNPSAANANKEYATATYSAPSALTATGANTTQVNLAWTDTTVAESGFAISRCPGPAPCATSYSDVITTAAAVGSYSDTSACSGSTYNYAVAPMLSPSMPLSNGGGQVWKSKAPLTFTNFQANFATQVVVNYDTDMQSDYRDIRFYDRDAQQELPYWVQSSSASSATVWLKTGATSGIDLYFGNAAATSASSRDGVLGTGLVGCWPFEEAPKTSGTTVDVSGSGLTGNLNGFGTGYGIVTGGKYGNALKLNGTSSYVSVSDTGYPNSPLDITGSMSVEAWYYYQGTNPAWTRVLSKGIYPNEAYMFMFDGNGTKLLFLVNSGSNQYIQSGYSPVLTTGWHHLVGRYDYTNRTLSIFVDGVEYQSAATQITIAKNSNALGIGANSTGGGPASGLLDEVRVYNRALTNAEVAARYAATLPAVTVGAKVATGTAGTAATANVVTPAPANLVLNPDFESYTSNWSAWPNWSGISTSSTVFFSGKISARISETQAANATKLIYQPLTNLTPGGGYVLKGYVNAALAANADNHAFCYLTSWGVNWSSPAMWITGTDAGANNQGWVPFTVPFTIPLNNPGGPVILGNLECGIGTGAAGGGLNTAYFDAVQLVPDAPVTLTVARTSESEIRLSWNDRFADETGFNIYRCQGSGCTFGSTPTRQVGAGIVAFIDTGLVAGQTYRYQVTAYKTTTCPWESAPSNVAASETTQVAPVLQAAPLTATSMLLTWNDTTVTESGYTIERCMGNPCEPAGNELYHNVTPTARPLDGLRARYSFNGSIGDSSGGGLDLASYNNYAPAYEDGGVRLNSIYYLTSPTTSILDTDQHTIEFDIKFRSLPNSNRKIFGYEPTGSDRSPGIWTIANDSRISWRYDPGDTGVTNLGVEGVGGIPLTVGTWYHVMGVKNGSSFKVYVNNVLVSDVTVANPKKAGAGILRFGDSWVDVALKNFSIYGSAADPTLVTFTDTQACPNTYYNYRVTPYNPAWTGAGAGLPSNASGETTLVFAPPRTPFTAKAATENQVDLAWSASVKNDQTGFRLRTCQGGDCSESSIPNQTTYGKTGLTAEKNYCFAVAGFKATPYCNGIGGGDATGITSDYIDADICPTTTSIRPIDLTAEALGPFKIRLSWTDRSGDEDGFDIEAKLWNGQWVKSTTVVSTAAGKTDTNNQRQYVDSIGVGPLKSYTYRVRAIRGADRSPPSNEATATTPAFTKSTSGTCP
jgi:concanavalin A-like lectin/glucanase superfamily protein/uncharacterized protein DUF2341/carbohydrate binding protein with CBM4/9 domain